MKVRDDFINPEKNKSEDKFPINKHKPVFIVGIDDKGNILNEYAQDEKEVKEILFRIKDTCKKGSIKVYGIWAGKYITNIFDLSGLY